MRAALELGVNFPEDIRLITCTSRGVQLPYHKQVTRIEFAPQRQVEEAIELMGRLIHHPNQPEAREFLPGDLVQGETA